MRSVRLLTGLLAVCALSVSFNGAPANAQAGAAAGTDATIASVKTLYESVKGFITKAAAQVPEDKYGFAPTKEVRTMGQLFGHIANASAMFCNTGSGMSAAAMPDAEKLKSKAEIQKALAAGFSRQTRASGQ